MFYKIPLFNLNFGKEEEAAVINTLRSKWISMGENVITLENKFAARLKVEHAVALSNCTAALHLALRVLGIKEGDEVIVPSLTFVATVNAVRYVGATPVFADIVGPETLNLDPLDVEAKVTKKTKAIIVMHYGGFSCDMDAINSIARKNNIFLVEDAAHAPDAEYKGRKLGTLGDIGCFSFYSNKIITCAEGGMLVTKNPAYSTQARRLRSNGMNVLSYDRAKGHATDYDIVELGYNYRLDDIRAGILLAQLKKMRADISRRQKLRNYYIKKLNSVGEITIPYTHYPYRSSNYIFPIILNGLGAMKRNAVRQKLGEAGIQTSVHYPCVHRFSIYRGHKAHLPKTEYVADNLITLPLFHDLSCQKVDYIIKKFKEAI
jgi:dTDP-4-amino-4,6-dideoxygalactose transaminase